MHQGPRTAGPSRRGGLLALATSSLSLATLMVACGRGEPSSLELGRPPVVLIVLDALAAEHVGHLGYPRETTPALDALAAEGVSFRSAFAPAPYTVASIPSLLTGRRPDTHGVTSRAASLFEGEVTLAEALGQAGYRTRAVVANLNGGPSFGATQGFEEVIELYVAADGRSVDIEGRGGMNLHKPAANEMLPYVERWVGERDARPLFLYLHVLEPHSPYDPPAEFRNLWVDPDYAGPFVDGDSMAFVAEKKGEIQIDEADRQAARDLYDANLCWADHNVGLVLQDLRDAGLYDDALIIVTSDHGEAFWQHGQWGHNDQLYDEALRIPLIVKFPKGKLPAASRGAQPTGMVSLLDVMPSIATWLDLPVGQIEFDGISLDATIAAQARAADAIAGVSGSGRQLYLRTHHRVPYVGLRTETQKTILVRREEDGKTTSFETYSLVDDPGELQDLSRTRRKETLPVVRQLEDWIREATINRARRDIPLTVMEEKMLEALGYAGE